MGDERTFEPGHAEPAFEALALIVRLGLEPRAMRPWCLARYEMAGNLGRLRRPATGRR